MCYCQILNELSQNKEYYIKHPKKFKEIISNRIKNKLKGKILEEDEKTLKIDSPFLSKNYEKKLKILLIFGLLIL